MTETEKADTRAKESGRKRSRPGEHTGRSSFGHHERSKLADADIDYKNCAVLSRYVSNRGKIMPSRITGLSYKSQRKLSQQIKRARQLALMPYVDG